MNPLDEKGVYLLRQGSSKLESMDHVPDSEEVRDLIGGYFEPIKAAKKGVTIYADADGKLKSKPVNAEATRIMGRPGDFVVGDVVVFVGYRGPKY